ncbi:MAG: helix-turn-helix domain-containing protein [Suipraeoptans sp.]
MNISYLMQYISAQLNTIVRIYSCNNELLDLICSNPSLQIDALDNEAILLIPSSEELPRLISGSQKITYAAINTETRRFLVGPVILNSIIICNAKLPVHAEINMYLFPCDLSFFIDKILLLHNLYHRKVITTHEVIAYNCTRVLADGTVAQKFTDLVFENRESSLRHNPYEQELREISSIQNGNLEQLTKSWEETYEGKVGTLARTSLRHSKNHGIVLVTLASRAAMNGGILPEIAFSLSDSYIQTIEECTIPDDAFQLGRQAEYHYTTLVNELKSAKTSPNKRYSAYVNQCKDYIFIHLHEKIAIADIAKKLFLSPCYLSSLFKKEEGITIGEYILKEKTKLAQNMLVHSDYSYAQIAAYLGFSSQSHLGSIFKKATGLTLRQYRDQR